MEAESKERQLGWGAVTWVAALALALMASFLAGPYPVRSGPASPLFWVLTGAIGMLLPALIISLIVWGVRGAKPGGGRATFLVLTSLFFMGQLGRVTDSASADRAVKQLAPAQVQWKSALIDLISDPNLDEAGLPEARRRLHAPFASIGEEGLYGDGLKLQRASIERMKVVSDEELRIAVAVNDLVRADVLSSQGLDAPGEIDRRVAIVQKMVQASRRYETFQFNQASAWEQILTDEGIGSRTRRATLAGLEGALKERLPRLKELTEARIQWCGLIIEWLDHLRKTLPGWRVLQSGSIEFVNDADAERFNQIGERVDQGTEVVDRLERAMAKETDTLELFEAKEGPTQSEI